MKRWKLLYTVAVSVLLAAPLLLMPFASGKSAEKRNLSSSPALVNEEGVNLSFTAQVDTWLSEHFPFRSELISANNYAKATAFATSDEEQVIVGKDGWLYFSETLSDYFGDDLLSDRQLQQYERTLCLMEEHVRQSGSTFVFTVAPNKNTVYPQYMPDRYQRATVPSDLQRLTERLRNEPYFADMTGALSDSAVQLYHARDSHWNAFGALCGYRELMATANRKTDLFDSCTYSWQDIHRGDLDDMILPASPKKDAQAVYDVEWSYEYTSNYHSEEDLLITTENQNGEGSLLMYRDSFGNALLPFMAQTYQRTTFSRVMPYNLCDCAQYDTVVVEIVERNLDNLLRTAPVMPAPRRDNLASVTVHDAVVHTREENGMLHVYGTLPEDAVSERVYLHLLGGNDTATYEAFPIYEYELLDDRDDGAENGFSAYIPANEAAGCTITVMVGKED